MIERAVMVLAGLGQGILVGGAAMLMVTILDILPRLAVLSGVKWPINVWAGIFTGGMLFSCAGSLLGFTAGLPVWLDVFAFVFFGAYVGVLLMALAETLDLFPAGLGKIVPSAAMKGVLIMLVVGKLAGSVLYWLFPQFWR